MAGEQVLAGRLVMTGIVIVTYRNTELTLRCLRSIESHLGDLPLEVVVVNNAPGDGTAEAIATSHSSVQVIESPKNEGFAAGCNRGAAVLSEPCRSVLFLNPDTELRDDSIKALLDYFDAHPRVGIAGSRLLHEDGSHQPSVRQFPSMSNLLFSRRSPLARIFPNNRWTRRYHHADRAPGEAGPVESVGGAVMLIRRELFREIDGFDEAFFLYVEDTDICYRAMQRGWDRHYVPAATVFHRRGSSAAHHRRAAWLEHQKGIVHFLRKHRRIPRPLGILLALMLRLQAALLGSPRLRALWMVLLVTGCASGDMHQNNALLLTTTQEHRLGQDFAQELEGELRLLRDPRVLGAVERIGRTISRASERPGLRYNFHIIDDDREINAFAIPGGGIYIHTGLLLELETEAELAAVLAHEIGHVAAYHTTRPLHRSMGANFILELSHGEHPEFWVEQARAASTPGTPMPLVQYTREDEYEADALATVSILRAGWDPYAMVGVLEGIEILERKSPSRLQRWLTTHPPTRERIRRISEELARRNLPVEFETGIDEYNKLLDYLR